ncbi:MAG: sigma 54-interacting transcriptional regulator [Clostridiales Family XIII bacterium]|jgi:transcriptional regulator of acetoin/glycerol metabolism|nr:sigma 54-interacting transcriptional regulator [Clostridiales Family XIII bacterium]
MSITENVDQKLLAKLWQRYIAGDEPMPSTPPSGIRPVIYESWKRSKSNKISPLDVKDRILKPDEMQKVIRQNQALISVAHPYLQNLYSLIKGSNFAIALTNEKGDVIDLLGLEGNIEERAHRSSLTIGCNRSEAYAGTCGIGTCLALGEPIQIWGCEHYIKPHHNYVCSAAPIKNDVGQIIGTIDLIGPSEAITEHTLGMVCTSVDAIEKQLQLRKAYENIHLSNRQMTAILGSLSHAILMIDNTGVITQYNNSVSHMLKLPSEDLSGKHISEILDLSMSSIDLLGINKHLHQYEISIVNMIGLKLNLSLSTSIIKNDSGEKKSTVLILEERKKINTMATRISGFTAKYSFDEIIGSSDDIKEVKAMGQLAAKSDSNVLILGESGTGKDLLAQSIHNASARASGPFITINCGSLPKSLVESELFGYESGAFTGASKDGYPGKFELAEGGTIFLDEIGDMPLEIQASLLRVLQLKKITRIGGKTEKDADVRIIAATNVNLAELIEAKRFRRDLYYRLNVLTFTLPPLRQRMNDVHVLTEHFISIYNKKMSLNVAGFSPTAYKYLMEYTWPGNVRELENTIERAMNLITGDRITERELGQEIIAHSSVYHDNYTKTTYLSPRKREHEVIADTLKRTRGNVIKASAALGMSKRTLYRRIDKYCIDLSEYRLW